MIPIFGSPVRTRMLAGLVLTTSEVGPHRKLAKSHSLLQSPRGGDTRPRYTIVLAQQELQRQRGSAEITSVPLKKGFACGLDFWDMSWDELANAYSSNCWELAKRNVSGTEVCNHPIKNCTAYVFGNTSLSRFARRAPTLAQPRVDLGQIGSGFSEVVSLSALCAFLLPGAAGQGSALLVTTQGTLRVILSSRVPDPGMTFAQL